MSTGGASVQEYPCSWVTSVDEAFQKTGSDAKLLYILFHSRGPRLPGNFYTSQAMQKVSTDLLTFVDLTVPKSVSDEKIRDLLKRCRVTALPMAVIADRYGNPLVLKASTGDPALLEKQAKSAEAYATKIRANFDEAYAKAKQSCKEKDWAAAAASLSSARKVGFVGLPIVEKIEKLYKDIDAYLAKRLAKIQAQDLPKKEKSAALKELRSQAYKDLPVYKKIAAACSSST